MKTRPTYTWIHRVASIIMIAALSWLTISLPYIYSFQKELSKQESRSAAFNCPVENEESNPLTNSTEEKAPAVAEEYLHHSDDNNYLFNHCLSHDNRHAYDIYIAFHGEITLPPPDHLS
jgi:hypothetical protein